MFPRVSKQVLPALGIALLFVGSSCLRADTSPPILPDFMRVSWLAEAAPTLAKAAVATSGVAIAPAGTGIQKTDTVTLLVQALDDKTLRQWAVVLSINGVKPEERSLRSPALTVYLNTGHKIDFDPSPLEGMSIHVLGRFSDRNGESRAKDVWSGSLVNPLFLGLGLDTTAAFFIRVDQKVNSDPVLKGKNFSIATSSNPFPPKRIADDSHLVEQLCITGKEEQAYAGVMPALQNFFQIASLTPGVRDIVFEMLDLPWWSIAAHGGRITDTYFELLSPIEELSAADWNLPPEMRVYSMGLRLFLQGKPALHCRLALTAPRVPLLNCAGIVGLAAMRPDGKGPHLMIRVMAAKPAAPAPGP